MTSQKIKKIRARQVFDSRGIPTIEVDVTLDGGTIGRSIAPSGASRGKLESVELRDNDLSMYGGMSVFKAINLVNDLISKELTGREVEDQEGIDGVMIELDGTKNKGRLGGNTIIALSSAVSVAAAKARGMALFEYIAEKAEMDIKSARMPLPIVQIIGGGLHGGWNLDVQDFAFIPIRARTYSDAMTDVFSIRAQTAKILKKYGFENVLVSDEGGIAPHLHSNEQAISILVDAMEEAGIKPGTDGGIGLDVAASQLFSGGKYNLGIDDKHLSTDEMISMLEKWVERYPILSIEDGLSEDDWDGWVNLTRRLGNKVQIIGDDLFVTARTLLLKGIDLKCANAILIKPNQVGTITETIETMKIAFKNNFKTIVSARSGDTEDNYIADFAVGTNAGQIKIGANTRSERLSKYNQLLRIEEVLANNNISEIEFSHE